MRRSALLPLAAALLVSPAVALDCSKAKAPVEKAICADPATAAADKSMEEAYGALSGALPANDRKALLASQRAWLKQRTAMCSEDKACLLRRTTQRRAYLAGLPESGPGSGQRLVPVLRQEDNPRDQYEIDVEALNFATPASPGEKLFNIQVDTLLKDVPKNEPRDASEPRYSSSLDLSISYASTKFLSAHAETYSFTGGAHGNGGTTNINIDMERGKLAAFDDLFEPRARAAFEEACVAQFKRQKAEKDSGKIDEKTWRSYRDTINDSIGALERWSFSADKAAITFDAYALGSYAEGAYECSFDAEMLKRQRKAYSILQ